MNARERIKAVIEGKPTDRGAFWLGSPHPDSWQGYRDCFHLETQQQIRKFLNDDFYHVSPEKTCWKNPHGDPVFDWTPRGGEKPAPMADFESIEQVEQFYWPDTQHLDFTETIAQLESLGPVYRASGMACGFYSHTQHAFGMTNYFTKLYTNPEVVQRATAHITEFFLEANEILFRRAGDLIDGIFIFNDFGTQIDLQMRPEMFDKFVIPWLSKFVDQAHRHNYHAIVHSCGSIIKIIDRLIDIGVDIIHPIQAKATDMDAERIAKDFYGKVIFMGGIDTQELLVRATPEQVEEEVFRVKKLLAPNIIISPSHETLLPDVPPANVLAMARAAAMI